MNNKRIIFYGFLIWMIMFLFGMFFFTFVPGIRNVFIILAGLLVVYTFLRMLLYEKNILFIGLVWFLINFVLNVVILHYLMDYDFYYSQWSFWIFYALLIVEPAIVKRFI